jgi:alpha-beta hydrolase superfamily lysophospholipase
MSVTTNSHNPVSSNYKPHFGAGIKLYSGLITQGLAAGYLKAPKLSRLRPFISLDTFSKTSHLDHEPVYFTNSDGMRLSGFWFPTQPATNQTMILGHGYCAHSGSMAPLIQPFLQTGHNVFLFDFRAHGKSQGARTSLGFHEGKDLAAAMQFIHEKYGAKAEKISYLGHSMGAAAFLFLPKSIEGHVGLLELIDQRLQKIILDSSYAVINPSDDPNVTKLLKFFPRAVQHWFLRRVHSFEKNSDTSMQLPAPIHQLFPADLYTEAGRFKDKPILILHGKKDTRTSYAQGEEILKTLNQKGFKAKLVALNANHFINDWKPTPGRSRYRAILRDDLHYVESVKDFLKEAP